MADKTTTEEPSIEEILGSIRRIIAEDEEPTVDDEPLELTNKIDSDGTIVNTPPPAAAPVAEEMNISFDEPEQTPPAPVVAPAPDFADEEAPTMSDDSSDDTILSRSTADATAAVMSRLARHTAVNETTGNATIEGIVREMLKPMLRDWLDENLPGIVQKMVDRELQRLSGRV